MTVITAPTFADYLRHLRRGGSACEFPAQTPPETRPTISRTQLASDADISTGYLIKLEQGHADSPTPSIVDRLASALGVSELVRQHLHDLATPPQAHHAPPPARVSDLQKQYVDNLHPSLAGYVDEAWNVVYANAEYNRIFRQLDKHGNVLVWFFAERQSRKIMVEWEIEARLTVAWLRGHMARRRGNPLFNTVLSELARYTDFVQMWNAREILMGRHKPEMLVRDLDLGEDVTLFAQVFSTPDPSEALQLYLGAKMTTEAGTST
ncbi:helix-turn-helix domain-containing protein [Amycolatopsis saalfeldensis]|uniref:Helix-turn-helix domain-containing protein n=1 Tax=Amycolatopsis saalfeldensis TaxID=394193 RepID=A0A1H8YR78_9PSEU|nr:helix-turn-helix domain-containing protein [Amycolatopsis saalfeldensis]SEP54511.1 Helix-turn-helix domain-containing protein [Amycolatopsis saalfeldensis]